ncbi:hypothetical protein [Celeribacter litoreus]|uniref:hypothetical protein n=1 Tax=Celeribacter litoreus TaxID=2876714 RepID=UPI001CCB592D|nr:hypothetical protein [Celeribacter litoreus]MCA0042115.1 hypothetical protein [Celeribacter litoreus]
MKKLAAATVFALAGTAAFAGGYSEPVMEAPVVIEETSSSSTGYVVPLLILALVAAAVAAD